jgi:tryptophan halogenase
MKKNYKIVIVGGGTAGWLCAAWISKKFPNVDLRLIESPQIPKIGVGESVTPHVSAFFNELGIEDKHWMKYTGAVHKYANKFIGWRGDSDFEHFSFSYPTKTTILQKELNHPTSKEDLIFRESDVRTTDTLMKLLAEGTFDKFDKHFNSQYYYMMRNVAPFDDNGNYLLNPFYSWSQHINAERAADYARDYIALPNGVKHIQAKVKEVLTEGNNIKSLILCDDSIIDSDLFIDASGFHKVLVKNWPTKDYTNNTVNSAWVCQLDYIDQEKEMVNYTQSIAQNYGWLFKIGLYHRMGSGYCYDSNYISDDAARESYINMIGNRRAEPRLLKWKPQRLQNSANGNVVAIGLSCGFVEPMEANALFIIVNSIVSLTSIFDGYNKTGVMNFKNYNEKISYCIDDIADFILVHYTLSSRNTTKFWLDKQELGLRKNHKDLVYKKYMNKNNTMASALDGYSLFPEYMWAQLAHSWGLDLSQWKDKTFTNLDLELTRLYYQHLSEKHNIISQTRPNNYQWLKNNIFNGLESKDWEKLYLQV